MNCIEFLVFLSYILSLFTLSFIPQYLYTGKDVRDTQQPVIEELDDETEEGEEEEAEETDLYEETQSEPHEENYTQTENSTLRRRTVIFNEKDGTTTIITEYV